MPWSGKDRKTLPGREDEEGQGSSTLEKSMKFCNTLFLFPCCFWNSEFWPDKDVVPTICESLNMAPWLPRKIVAAQWLWSEITWNQPTPLESLVNRSLHHQARKSTTREYRNIPVRLLLRQPRRPRHPRWGVVCDWLVAGSTLQNHLTKSGLTPQFVVAPTR